MPKVKKDAVHRHFTYDEETNYSKCIHCRSKIKGHHATNYKNHLSAKHKDIYDDVLKINNNKENICHADVRKKDKFNKIKLNCLKLITVHGRPFQLLEDKAFQEIINLAMPAKETGDSIINIKNIKSMINDQAYDIKSKIAVEVREKLLCLKLDSATYQDRSFIGINIQHIKNGAVTIRTLATIEVFQRQTGEFLKEALLEVLNDFKIEAKQIYCITTDNGKNFKKMAKLLGASYEPALIEDDADDSETDEEENDYDDNHIDDLLTSVIEIDSSTNSDFTPRTMLCAAHTLQLAIKDFIEANPAIKNLLVQVRQVVKLLRTPTVRNILKRANLKKPVIDCPTRWSSTYNMLSRLLLLKTICLEDPTIMSRLDESRWQTITDLVECLKPCYTTTLILQKEQLTLGDFFIEWLKCKGYLEQNRTAVSQSLLECMKTRETNLLNTNVMLEALYLDTRLNVILSDGEAAKARELLLETLKQIQKIKLNNNDSIQFINDDSIAGSSGMQSPDTSHQSDNTSYVEDILRRTEQERGIAQSHDNNLVDVLLRDVRNLPRLSHNDNILQYWNNKLSAPELSELALCVLATPATQVSVERLFSSVKFILSPLRSNLNKFILENIMVIRSNQDLFD